MCVRKDLQGKGIGSIVMSAANQAILAEGKTGLLSCDTSMTPFYVHCGWRRVDSPLLRSGEVTMQLIEAAPG
jgi:GNAT superfamily N-acetyltransferase